MTRSRYNDSFFFTDIVEQIVPYTVGAFVWDQAERDVVSFYCEQ
jgi:hypothetical protein